MKETKQAQISTAHQIGTWELSDIKLVSLTSPGVTALMPTKQPLGVACLMPPNLWDSFLFLGCPGPPLLGQPDCPAGTRRPGIPH